MKLLILFFLLSQFCFARGNADINTTENEAEIKIFYCRFNVSTIVPLSTDGLIKNAEKRIEVRMEKDLYDATKQYFADLNLERPQSTTWRIAPLWGYMAAEEENIPPYINARLVIQLSDGKDDFLLTIGTNHIISINETLFIPDNNFLTKICELLNIFGQDEVVLDILKYYDDIVVPNK